ncbi:Protein YIP5 [Nakaseomyces bracarensis]|uniref:Protein YIP5 n=1 Tax=Nakaseomyces bracarensis TaxID=273131 RepID=A0ABR4NVT3_9SACH
MAGSDLFDIDDGMEGVDDFITDPNPFEEQVHSGYGTNAANNNNSDQILGDVDIGNKVKDLPPTYDSSLQVEPERVAADSTIPQGKLPPGLLNYYSRYFQLDSAGLKKRIMYPKSFYENRNDVEEQNFEIGDEDDDDVNLLSDLYGPVWITASAVMAKFVTVGIVEMIKNGIILGVSRSSMGDETFLPNSFWEKQFISLIHSIWLFYAHTFVTPLLIFKGFQNHYDGLKMKSRYEIISIYGYSNLVWVTVGLFLGVLEGYTQPVAKYTKWIEFIIFGVGIIPVYFYILRESMYRIEGKVVDFVQLFKEVYKVPFVVVLFLLVVFWLIYGFLILL